MVDFLVAIMMGIGILKYLSLLGKVIFQRKIGALSLTFSILNVVGYAIGVYIAAISGSIMLPYFIALTIITLVLLIALVIRKRQKARLRSADNTFKLALEFFETEDAAEAWWITPNKYLGGASPEGLVNHGHNDVVRKYLGRLNEGIPL